MSLRSLSGSLVGIPLIKTLFEFSSEKIYFGQGSQELYGSQLMCLPWIFLLLFRSSKYSCCILVATRADLVVLALVLRKLISKESEMQENNFWISSTFARFGNQSILTWQIVEVDVTWLLIAFMVAGIVIIHDNECLYLQ